MSTQVTIDNVDGILTTSVFL